MKKALAVLLAAVMCCTLLSACGQPETTDPTEGTEGTQTETNAADLVYAVEAGSAGEAIAKEKGWQTNPVTAQADTLMEVSAGTSDAAIIDLLMAAAMTGEGTSYPDLTYDSQGLTTEEYGIGCRKGSDLAQYINNVLAEAYADAHEEIATTYKLQDALGGSPPQRSSPLPQTGMWLYPGQGYLIVGITEFEPMDYKDENGQWIGFDADMAKVMAEKLGVEVQFVVIDWDNKIMELDSKNVDVLWNGMTLTDEVKNSMECTNPYFNNAQVVVTAEVTGAIPEKAINRKGRERPPLPLPAH
ncbi:MAG: transporter substrate-binding domain-containing protein [Evtepia gabavorous]